MQGVGIHLEDESLQLVPSNTLMSWYCCQMCMPNPVIFGVTVKANEAQPPRALAPFLPQEALQKQCHLKASHYSFSTIQGSERLFSVNCITSAAKRNMNVLYTYPPFYSPLPAQKRSDISALLLTESIPQFSWICFHIDSTFASRPQEVQHRNTTPPKGYRHVITPSAHILTHAAPTGDTWLGLSC